MRLAQGRDHSPLGGPTVALVGSTADGKHILQGRMSLILERARRRPDTCCRSRTTPRSGRARAARPAAARSDGRAARAGRQPAGRRRDPGERPALGAAEQAGFKKVMLQESQFLCARLETLAAQYRDVITGHWPMSDIFSSNLLQNLADRLREQRGIEATVLGLPQWLHGDSYSLVELLDRLIARRSAAHRIKAIDLETVAGGAGSIWTLCGTAPSCRPPSGRFPVGGSRRSRLGAACPCATLSSGTRPTCGA